MQHFSNDLAPRISLMTKQAAEALTHHAHQEHFGMPSFLTAKGVLMLNSEEPSTGEHLVYFKLGDSDGFLSQSGKFLDSNTKRPVSIDSSRRELLERLGGALQEISTRIECQSVNDAVAALDVSGLHAAPEDEERFQISAGLLSFDIDENIAALDHAVQFVRSRESNALLEPHRQKLEQELDCIMLEDAVRLWCRPQRPSNDETPAGNPEVDARVMYLVESLGKSSLEWISDYCSRIDFERTASSGTKEDRARQGKAVELLYCVSREMLNGPFDVWASDWADPAQQLRRGLTVLPENEQRRYREAAAALEDLARKVHDPRPFPIEQFIAPD